MSKPAHRLLQGRHAALLAALSLAAALPAAAQQFRAVVAANGSADFQTVQTALDAAPESGGVITIKPGAYREVIAVNKPHIVLRGLGKQPQDVVLSCDKSAGSSGGTFNSPCTTVSADDFLAENLTFENTFSRERALTHEGSQAVALRVMSDRSVFRNVRILGYQDTLLAESKSCAPPEGQPCQPAREFFSHCYIEGNVDYIFGDALAYFQDCEIHSLAHATVYITAQNKHYPGQQSGFVFDHCRLTADPGVGKMYLGRPWRAYATVVYLRTWMDRKIDPAGWHEWPHDGKPCLPTAFYAEYKSSGPGAKPKARESYSHHLARQQAEQFELAHFLAGAGHWNPEKVR